MTLPEVVADRIRARIMSGQIPIGAPLRQVQLAAELDVSRTSVREALHQLHVSDLVEVVPNRGAFVRAPSPWEVRAAYEVRAELEGLACERAAGRIDVARLAELRALNDAMHKEAGSPTPGSEPGVEITSVALNDDFHSLIHLAADNERLTRAIDREVNQAFPRNVAWLVFADNRRRRMANVVEHDRIVAALAAGDGAIARAEMRAHVIGAGEQLARWYERSSVTVMET